MYALATGTVSILRGSTQNEYLDDVDVDTVVASGVLASLRETSNTSYDPATGTPRVVRNVQCVISSTYSVTESDRIRDDVTGVIYTINAVTRPQETGRTPDLVLTLERTT